MPRARGAQYPAGVSEAVASPVSRTENMRRDRVMRLAVLIVAVAFVYWPAVTGDWLWDDNTEITENPVLRAADGLRQIWFDPPPQLPDYFPLKTSLQWMLWQIWGDNPVVYHLTSVAFHLLGSLLLWRVFSRLGVRFAWSGALLFAVHPVVVESVAWIAELKNVTSFPLMLLALLAWIDFDEHRRTRDLLIALAWFAAAALCKPTVVTLPAMLLLFVWWKRARVLGRDIAATLPFFAVAIALSIVAVHFQHSRAIADWPIDAGPWLTRIARAGLAAAFYLGTFIAPFELAAFYPKWDVQPPSAGQFLPWLVSALLVAWLWHRRATWGRHALFGFGCYVLSLAPVAGFIAMSFMRFSWVADHFAYIAVAVLSGLTAAGAALMADRTAPRLHRAWGVAAAVGLIAFSVLGHRYAHTYRDARSLWTHALATNPDAWAAQTNVGAALLDEGRIEEALHHLGEALRVNPNEAFAHFNLGNALSAAGRLDEAVAAYETALALEPRAIDILLNLGSALADLGRPDAALVFYRRALALQPRAVDAHINLGLALTEIGRLDEAVEAYETALRLGPGNAAVHVALADALMGAGRTDEAIRHYETALRLQPDMANAHHNLGCALVAVGRAAEGAVQLETARRLAPGDAETRFNLAGAYAMLGRPDDALREYHEALRLRPDYADAHYALGNLLVGQNQLNAAIDAYRTALHVDPAHLQARTNLGHALLLTGRNADAVAEFEAAVRLSPDDHALREALTRARQLRDARR